MVNSMRECPVAEGFFTVYSSVWKSFEALILRLSGSQTDPLLSLIW